MPRRSAAPTTPLSLEALMARPPLAALLVDKRPPHATPFPEVFGLPREGLLPTCNLYLGEDGGYIAVYSHDRSRAAYSVSDDIHVIGRIRIRGRYRGRIFTPKGFDGVDISADPDMKSLCEALFPGGEVWAGGDTGGWYDY